MKTRVSSQKSYQKSSKLSKSERTKARIMQAAIDIIASKGIERATTREIAKKAKVANGLVSHYFPEIDLIFDEVIREIAQEAYHSIENPPESSSGHDKLIHMCRANMEFFFSRPRYLKCFLLFYYFCSIRANLREMNTVLIERAQQRCREYLSQHFSETRRVSNRIHEQKLDAYSMLVHNHLMSAILKYLMIENAPDKEAYITRFLSELNVLIQAI